MKDKYKRARKIRKQIPALARRLKDPKQPASGAPLFEGVGGKGRLRLVLEVPSSSRRPSRREVHEEVLEKEVDCLLKAAGCMLSKRAG